jgi:hypothetical protein
MQMIKATDSSPLLWTAFLRSCQKYPKQGALDVGDREVIYEQLANRVKASGGCPPAECGPRRGSTDGSVRLPF